MLDHEHEGFVLLPPVLEPIHGQIGNHVGAISVDAFSSVRENHIGVVIKSLSGQDCPIVVSLWFSLQMAFSIDCGLVACLLQELGKGLLIPVKGIPIVHEAILVAVLAGLNDRSAGSAY